MCHVISRRVNCGVIMRIGTGREEWSEEWRGKGRNEENGERQWEVMTEVVRFW